MLMYRLASRLVHGLARTYVQVRHKQDDPMWRGRLLKDLPEGPVDLWLHAASAGEAKVASILTGYLRKQRPDLRIHITVMTRAGHQAALKLPEHTATISYYPLDIGPLVNRMVDALRPSLVAVAETEIWPHMVTAVAKRKIPLVLVNGRMSGKAFRRYRMTHRMLSRLLSKYDRFFLKTEKDRRRFAHFGVPDSRIVVTGDMKFDAPLPQRSPELRQAHRDRLQVGNDDVLFVAGSTRPGEEEQLIDVYRSQRQSHPHLKCLLVPRHIERAQEVCQLVRIGGMRCGLYSEESDFSDADIVVIDTMGILMELYEAADLAFVGGTLVPINGHNILEPVWAGTPVLFGPYTANVEEAAAYISTNDYGAQAASIVDLQRKLEGFLSGTKEYRIKTDEDSRNSATAGVCAYLLSLLPSQSAPDGAQSEVVNDG